MKQETKISKFFAHPSAGMHRTTTIHGSDHVHTHGTTPKGHSFQQGNPARTVKSIHQDVHGAKGMESHGCPQKVTATVPGGKGKPARLESDMKVAFRKSM